MTVIINQQWYAHQHCAGHAGLPRRGRCSSSKMSMNTEPGAAK